MDHEIESIKLSSGESVPTFLSTRDDALRLNQRLATALNLMEDKSDKGNPERGEELAQEYLETFGINTSDRYIIDKILAILNRRKNYTVTTYKSVTK